MKKILPLFVLLVMITGLIGAFYLSQNKQDLRSRANHSDPGSDPTKIIPIINQSGSNINQSTLNQINNAVATLYPSVSSISNLNQIVIASTYPTLQNASAYTVINNGVIVIDPSSLNNPNVNIAKLVSHELIHTTEHMSPGLLQNFQNTFGLDKPGTGTGIGNNTSSLGIGGGKYDGVAPNEVLAHYGAEYVNDPEKLEQEDPKMYNWLKENVFNGKEFKGLVGEPPPQVRKFETDKLFSIGFSPVMAADNSEILVLAKLESIIPGQTTLDEVNLLLGTPTSTRALDDKLFYSYRTSDGLNYHTIVFRYNLVDLVTIHYGDNSNEFIEESKPFDRVTTNIYRDGTYTYFYFQDRLALTADLNGRLRVKQKFTINNYLDFISQWGQDYPSEISVSEPIILDDIIPSLTISPYSTTMTPVPTADLLLSPTSKIINPTEVPSVLTPTTGSLPPIVTLSPTPIKINCTKKSSGDANCDGRISGLDYVDWLNTQCNPEGMQVCTKLSSDFNGDRKVNNTDYDIWFGNRGS